MIRLGNGATPRVWHVRRGGDAGGRTVVGRGLAHLSHNTMHPYVVWSMSSDDGEVFDCEGGDYCATIGEAETIFARRAQTVPRRDGVTNQGETYNG